MSAELAYEDLQRNIEMDDDIIDCEFETARPLGVVLRQRLLISCCFPPLH